MFDYPTEIFGAKMREEKFGAGEEQYILYCYDIFGGTYSVRVDGYFISSRFDYGDVHSSSFRSRDGFEGFEKTAGKLVKLVLDCIMERRKMKCDELNPQHVMDVTGKAIDEISRLRAAIAELKQKLQDQCISCPVKMQEDDVVAELKANLEDAKATAYAESVDAGMRERRLKRELWLARAERALAERRRYCAMAAFEDFENDALRIKWCIIQHKCLKKAEEYK